MIKLLCVVPMRSPRPDDMPTNIRKVMEFEHGQAPRVGDRVEVAPGFRFEVTDVTWALAGYVHLRFDKDPDAKDYYQELVEAGFGPLTELDAID